MTTILPTNPKIDGSQVTFEWRGSKPAQLVGDFNDWELGRPHPLKETRQGVWVHSMELPMDAYIEYSYFVEGKRVPDPANPRKVYNGINAYNNYFYMPKAAPTPWITRQPGVASGKVSHHSVTAQFTLGDERKRIKLFQRSVYLYRPVSDEPTPLLVVFDGQDYLRRAKLPTILDNMIAQRRIRPLSLAMIAHGGRNRFIEYACSEATVGFINCTILPLARKELNLLDIEKNPGAYGVMGASMGGLSSLYIALRKPEIFGNVLSQSGSFYPEFVIYDLLRQSTRKDIRVWLGVGRLEFPYEYNLRMHSLLTELGYPVAWHAYQAEHNFTAWRDSLALGLEHLFGI
jgi:enterochelin esterase family protein